MDITKTCPACNGDLVDPQFIQGGMEDGELVWDGEAPCRCTETDTPGIEIIGTIDLSDLTDTVNDILNEVKSVKEKVDEIKGVVDGL